MFPYCSLYHGWLEHTTRRDLPHHAAATIFDNRQRADVRADANALIHE